MSNSMIFSNTNNTAPAAFNNSGGFISSPLSSSSTTTQQSRKRTAHQVSNRGSTSGVIIPQPALYDVLCGKDKTYAKQVGNRAFKSMIDAHVGPYIAAGRNKNEKMRITKQIVAGMQQQYETRFLRPIKAGKNKTIEQQEWQEITDAMARDKVSHALRFAAKQQKQTNSKKQAAGARVVRPSSTMTSSSSESSSLHESASSLNAMDVVPPSRGETPQPAVVVAAAQPLPAEQVFSLMNDSNGIISMNDSNGIISMNDSNASILSVVMPDDPEAMYGKMDTLFHRQQTILGHMAAGFTTAAGALITNIVSKNTKGKEQQQQQQQQPASEREFNTLRSDDLNAIFSEPVYDYGWDNEMAQEEAKIAI